ncbi:hypothetical protein V0M98_38670 (plasmid) [Pseudomonas silesiensis]|uniref:hypothetical protein n=1 Tax=Pseudomonas silesiensis TaxID=1853130 RepID=UPI0030D2B436
MHPITTAHCNNSTYIKRWAGAPALAELIGESFKAMESAIAEGEALSKDCLRTLYREFYLRVLEDRAVGDLSLLLGRLDKDVRQFVYALETDLLAKEVYVDLYPLRQELNWYQESYYHAYWMTRNQDTPNALDFVRSGVRDQRHYFVDNLCTLARSQGRFEVFSALLSLDDIELEAFQATYCRADDFDYALEKSWLTHLVHLGLEGKGYTEASRHIWAHCLCDVIERTAGEDRHLSHTASRLMFEVLESFPEAQRALACDSMKTALAAQGQAGYVNNELFKWCDFNHYFGMSASEAALQIHAGTLTMDWKQRFLLSFLEESDYGHSVTKERSEQIQEFQIIGFAEELRSGSNSLKSTFYEYVDKTFANIANDYEVGTSMLVNHLCDNVWPTNKRKVDDVVSAYHHCLRQLFQVNDESVTVAEVDRRVTTIKSKMVNLSGVSRSFFTLGVMLGQSDEIMVFFENLVEKYAMNPAFLHEISGLDKELMCKNNKFAASIFSKDLGL